MNKKEEPLPWRPTTYPPMPWVCPSCGRVYGPHWPHCQACKSRITEKEKQSDK